ncbi:pantoate--beta-alanine ligase [Adhaeribacter radiodurans]|uniref:Pantothenate synthetase n=1 Tax=Adhaeribacter radiodurans TaxID=2745197 RepID=A0A7L7LF59_9BACT|nr:pantoate--beta-alanine ligase [Adhaeribacter radiodurans]QMU31009.1 pantoate--beta-alanine ligase [Adhaeribacter radiodurans]
MQVITHLSDIKLLTEKIRATGKTIGFVPTMGALHLGHLELLRTASRNTDVTVCSIFVNPIQFNNAEDYRLYPKTIEKDVALLQENNCDIVFIPEAAEMYEQPALLKFNFGALEQVMEGFYRPGHFNGVATVVSKLFHLVKPHKAYFGQKDLQQFTIIRQLVRDLNFDLELICHEVVREADGLALSSRNQRLTPAGRQVAPRLYEALQLGTQLSEHRIPTVQEIKFKVEMFLQLYPQITLEYFEIVDAETLQPALDFTKSVALCLAAYLDNVRLIDNVILKPL